MHVIPCHLLECFQYTTFVNLYIVGWKQLIGNHHRELIGNHQLIAGFLSIRLVNLETDHAKSLDIAANRTLTERNRIAELLRDIDENRYIDLVRYNLPTKIYIQSYLQT